MSALLKLVVRENETSALEADLAERDGLLITYDARMAEAARTNGLRVVQPAAPRGN